MTHCTACNHEIRADARFCDACGAAVAVACSNCGTALRTDARFCDACGEALSNNSARAVLEPRAYTPKHLAEKILASKSALEGERKQVTVLFADVRGSMELSESVDPEEWHRILDKFFSILAEGVHRFEGTVNQYTGDGIMALFGAPIAHEDHAQRACYAALHLRESLRAYAEELKRTRGLAFAVRIGINSGEVVVGRIGDDLRMDYTAQGQTVGMAQRMEQLADPGRAYVAAPTARLVEGYFTLRDLGEFALKGVSAPQRVFDLEGVGALRTRLDVSRARGLSKFVGRATDLATLEGALARARDGQGHVVGIVAEPGVGKSRLCFEFVERCRAQGLTVTEGRALSHAKNIPLQTILPLFRGAFGIDEREEPRTAREKVAGRLLLLDESLRELLPLLFDFLGVADPANPLAEMDPEARQRRLFAALRRLVRSDSGQPRVTLIEDLHWIDAESEAFLAHWVDAIAGTRGLLVLNFRPEYHAEWMRRSHYQQLALSPLSAAAFVELATDLLGAHTSVVGLAEQLHARSGGNPFFAEEIVQSLIETGALTGIHGHYVLTRPLAALDVPPSVRAVLASRIDRLAEREKQLLVTAAVIGKEFDEGLLAAVAQLRHEDLVTSLAALERSEFLVPLALFPAVEWAFKHPLTQEVALGAQLAERKQRTHGAVARALMDHAAANLDERATEIAQHSEAAEEWLDAARWYDRAATWLEMNGTLVRSGECAQQAAVCADRAGADHEALELGVLTRNRLMRISWRLGLDPADADRIFEAGVERAARLGDESLRAGLLASRAIVAGVSGDNEARIRYGRESLQAELAAGQPGLLALIPIAFGLVTKGMMRACDELLVDLPVQAPHYARLARIVSGHLAGLLEQRAIARCALGRVAEALDDLAKARHLRRDADAEFRILHEYAVLEILIMRGDGAAAIEQASRCCGLSEAYGAPAYQSGSLSLAASAALLVGDRAAARAALAERDRIGSKMTERHNFALAHDDPKLIVSEAREALAQAQERSLLRGELEARFALARGLIMTGEYESPEVDAVLAPIEALIEQTGMRVLLRERYEVRATRAAARRDTTTHERELREALAIAQATGCDGHAARLAQELAR